jgi:hypothetical protein
MAWYSPLLAALRRIPPRPKAVLTIHKAEHLESGWEEQLGGFYALSAKVMDGKDSYLARGGGEALLETASQLGLKRHGWGHHYCQTVEKAQVEGAAAGAAAIELRLDAYWANMEADWGHGRPTQDTDATAIAFSQAFKRVAPEVPLLWNGFRASRYATPELMWHYDGWAPMLYGTRRDTIRNLFRAYIKRHPADIVAPMVGSGRISMGLHAYGYLDGPDGLDSLLREYRPDWVAFYYGSKGKGMLTSGNEVNPPLGLWVRDHCSR